MRVVVTYFWVPTQKMIKYKKKKRNLFRRNKKIIEARKECWNVEERLELVEEV
jgi:hypothetical protein